MASSRIAYDMIDKFFEFDLFLPTRTLYMGSVASDWDGNESGVDHMMAERVIKCLHVLDATSDQPITIAMNNPGGDWWHGMAIYDAIKACKSHVEIVVMGYAMSMGSIILQAADHRVMHPHSRLMVHYGYSGIPMNHPKIVRAHAAEDQRIEREMHDIYLPKIREKHPDYTTQELDALLDFDTFMTAQEAVDGGFADAIAGQP